MSAGERCGYAPCRHVHQGRACEACECKFWVPSGVFEASPAEGKRLAEEAGQRAHMGYTVPTIWQLAYEQASRIVAESTSGGLDVVVVCGVEVPQDYACTYERGKKVGELRRAIATVIAASMIEAGIGRSYTDRVMLKERS